MNTRIDVKIKTLGHTQRCHTAGPAQSQLALQVVKHLGAHWTSLSNQRADQDERQASP